MVRLAWWLWIGSFPWMAAVLEPSTLEDYERRCGDEQHVWCVQQGVAWLRSTEFKLTTKQRQRIIVRLAAAYVALGRSEDANGVLVQMLRKDACVRELPGLSASARKVFQAAKKQVLQDDVSSPIISHTPLEAHVILREPILKAKVTDDMKVQRVEAFVRYQSKEEWEKIPMTAIGGSRYRAEVSLERMKKTGYFAYYIVAVDCAQRASYAAGSAGSPRVLELVGKGPSPVVIGAGALIAVGVGLVVVGGVFFSRSNEGLKQWENTANLEESEIYREQIIFHYSMGWGGLALGGILLGTGIAMLVAPLLRPKAKDPAIRKEEVSQRKDGLQKRRGFGTMARSHKSSRGVSSGIGQHLLSVQ
ncbi:MAG: hypothetical protein H6728_08585 [Myxococcales bacterium]|nr:hypothetical protein [Myxococcales bacterium]MCB9643117.1 hypothetical protein [Myxococcales bacterium]